MWGFQSLESARYNDAWSPKIVTKSFQWQEEAAIEPHENLTLSHSRYLKSLSPSLILQLGHQSGQFAFSFIHSYIFVKYLLWFSFMLDATMAKEKTSVPCCYGVQHIVWTSGHWTKNHTNRYHTGSTDTCNNLKEHGVPKALKTGTQKDICMPVFIATLFTIAKGRNNLNFH